MSREVLASTCEIFDLGHLLQCHLEQLQVLQSDLLSSLDGELAVALTLEDRLWQTGCGLLGASYRTWQCQCPEGWSPFAQSPDQPELGLGHLPRCSVTWSPRLAA